MALSYVAAEVKRNTKASILFYLNLFEVALQMEHTEKNSAWRVVGLIWILVECNLVAGNAFGFPSLFQLLQNRTIYQSNCTTIGMDCSHQISEYQRPLALELAFYNLPAVVFGMIDHLLGPQCLKLIAIVFHLIGWISLGFAAPGHNWLILLHTTSISIVGICTLLSSISISAHFVQHRGLVTSLIVGAQLSGSIWYGIFPILIQEKIISFPALSYTWASFAILMLGSAFFFLDWRWASRPSILKPEPQINDEKAIVSSDTLFQHLRKPLFILGTLFLSCLILPISFFLKISPHWLWYNVSPAFGILLVPVCGLILDCKASLGHRRKLLNVSILQTIAWVSAMVFCLVCWSSQSTSPSKAVLVFLILSRSVLIIGSQALIAAVFPPQFIGLLLGIMWTTVGIINFATYGLIRLVSDPTKLWRAWVAILLLCMLMGGPLGEMWKSYFQSGKAKETRPSPAEEQELETFYDN